ncbi:hypothetical protein CDV36_015715 [Fusarium kuroshium]|uniref:Uncharacterized protein n=1 Tax=Fusarium kuroshium TaxID=2010991 RepID=A0A3M2R8D3_9HYPO|nr:hypothetical protein CDV36_015715 [Fusarium kuroshium]
MCRTNSSTLICGVPTSQYLNSSDKSMKVTFHPECKGRLFAAIAGSGHHQTILDIGNGDAPLTEEIDGFLQVCWETSHMNVGLWDFSATWLGLVVGLAEASVQFHTEKLSDEIVYGWLAEPTEAYNWLKDQMRKFQRQRHEISDIASDVPTFSEDMSVRQRALIDDKIDAIKVVNPSAILPNLENWHIRRGTHPDWENLLRRQNLIQFQLAAKEDGDPDIEALNAEGKRLDVEMDQAICGQSTARFYLELDSSTENLAWCLPCRTAAASILAAAFKRDQCLSISEPLPSDIEGAVANRLGMMTLSKQFRDAFMPRLRAMIKDEAKRIVQKGGIIKTNNGLKLCDDLANDRVSQWMKVAMEESSSAQSRAVVPQATAHKPAPRSKPPPKGLGASRFASPSPAAAAIPKVSPQAVAQKSTQATHDQPTPVPATVPVAAAASLQQIGPQAERVEARSGQYDVIQSSRLRELDLEVEADYELIQLLGEKGSCGTQ